jgi:hypothetical protein
MNLKHQKTIWLPKSYSTTNVTNRDDRKTQTYQIKENVKSSNTQVTLTKGKSVRAPNIYPYDTFLDEAMVDELTNYHIKCFPWNKILHLKPYISFNPKSMVNVLSEMKREIGRMEGKRLEYKPADWPTKISPFHAVIEFGDKFHGIHAHALVCTWLKYEELEFCWFNANLFGSQTRKENMYKNRMAQKIRKGFIEELDLDKAENKYSAVRYCVGNEIVYSRIDEQHGTNYSNDLLVKQYGKYKVKKT